MTIDETTRLREGAGAALDCDTAVRRLWDYLDGELAAGDRDAVDAHLAACGACPPHFDFERAFLAAMAASGAHAPTDDDSVAVLAALQHRVRAAIAVDQRDGR